MSTFTWKSKPWSIAARWAKRQNRYIKKNHWIGWAENQGAFLVPLGSRSHGLNLFYLSHTSVFGAEKGCLSLAPQISVQCWESRALLPAPPWEASREGIKGRSQEDWEPCAMCEEAPGRPWGGILEGFPEPRVQGFQGLFCVPLVWTSWEELKELPRRRRDFRDSEEAAWITLLLSRDVLRTLNVVLESDCLLSWVDQSHSNTSYFQIPS